MTNLRDSFPESFTNTIKNFTKLEKGAVLRMFCSDTNPPKVKMFVVLGLHENSIALGTLFINSEINEKVNFTPELKDLHYQLKSSENQFLKYDSFVDCSTIHQNNNQDILDVLNKDNDKLVGYLDQNTFEEIRAKVISAETIRGKYKKRFGLYSE